MTAKHRRFLLVNPFGIGDVLFTIPLIKNIRQGVPDAFIGYIANRRTAPLLQNLPEINQVIIYERDQFKETYCKSKFAFFRLLRDTRYAIRDTKYDVALDLSLNGYAAFFCRLAGIRERIGFNYKNRSRLLTRRIPLSGYEDRHVAEYYLDMLKELGLPVRIRSMEIPIPRQDQEWADDFLKKAGLLSFPVVAVAPGGGASWGKDAVYKRWPAQNYAKLTDKIIENLKVKVILLGGPEDAVLGRQIQDMVSHQLIFACGESSLCQSMALLARCDLAVVNDGGLLHMAVAAGTTTVSIFGPVDDAVYGPYPGHSHRVVKNPIACRPCYRNFRRARCEHVGCLSRIAVEDVFREVETVLREASFMKREA